MFEKLMEVEKERGQSHPSLPVNFADLKLFFLASLGSSS
jgi:hypothetical protein